MAGLHHPQNDHLLAAAQAGAADYLVTSDQRDLMALRPKKGAGSNAAFLG
jgi:predicted nucleic acid-binding protein